MKDDVVNCSISLFSGGGIGDLGIEYGAKIPIIAFCEIDSRRQKLLKNNYPNAEVFGDISLEKTDIITFVKNKLQGKRPLLISMSPPCQGMSTNGKGRINSEVAKGKRNEIDKRNSLILPALDIVNSLEPEFIIIENVPQMAITEIPIKGRMNNLLKVIKRRLKGYDLQSAKMDFHLLGVPHKRSRLITIGIRKSKNCSKLISKKMLIQWSKSKILPLPNADFVNNESQLYLSNVIKHLPEIKNGSFDPKNPFHCAPKLNDWHNKIISFTPEGKSAFHNNNCANISCRTINILTALRCKKCRRFLLKPLVTKKYCSQCKLEQSISNHSCEICNQKVRIRKRLVKGFKGTSYKRMNWEQVAFTITQNNGTISSDNKIHPTQNRSLSILELMILSTILTSVIEVPWHNKYTFQSFDSKEELLKCSSVPREVIGESIPPLAMWEIVKSLISIHRI